MTPDLRIGTAGWGIASRYAAQFPPGGSHLERYARRMNAVEINSSFYKPHQRKTYERWAASTPAGFRFAAKLPKAISHENALAGCGDLLDRFVGDVTGLGDRSGVLLLQLPPKFAFDEAIFDRFLDELRARIATPVALEPRHATWFSADVDERLREYHVARVAADPAPVAASGDPGGWNGLAYFRWHGTPRTYYSDYDEAALAALRLRLGQSASHVPTWCILDNTAAGAALGNAMALQD